MAKLIQDPFTYNLVILVFTIVAIIVATTIYFIYKKIKSINFYIINEHNLVNIDDEISKYITILYKGNLIKNLSSLSLIIKNTGNIAINKSDYEDDIRIVFNGDSEIINCEVEYLKPENINFNFSINNHILSINPFLLNKKEEVKINILVKNYRSKKLDIRLANVNHDLKFKGLMEYGHKLEYKYYSIILMVLLILFIIMVPILSNPREFLENPSNIPPTIFGLSIPIVVFLIYIEKRLK